MNVGERKSTDRFLARNDAGWRGFRCVQRGDPRCSKPGVQVKESETVRGSSGRDAEEVDDDPTPSRGRGPGSRTRKCTL